MDDSVSNDYYVDLRNVTPHELYDYICSEMSFNDVIELYRLFNYKINNLEDRLIDSLKFGVLANERSNKE